MPKSNPVELTVIDQLNKTYSEKGATAEVRTKLKSILDENSSLFDTKIGTVRDSKAKVYLKKDALPKFIKARVVPFALQDAADKELDRLVEENIFKPVPFSPWATPIVIVPKPDGDVRICGVFKQTANPNIETEVYSTPSNDEILTKI